MEARGIIRKLSINDVKNGLTYVVGQSVMGGRGQIVAIKLDPESSVEVGGSVYEIVVLRDGDDAARLWKRVEKMPVVAEYELEPEVYVEA
jgi:hypothetical protein